MTKFMMGLGMISGHGKAPLGKIQSAGISREEFQCRVDLGGCQMDELISAERSPRMFRCCPISSRKAHSKFGRNLNGTELWSGTANFPALPSETDPSGSVTRLTWLFPQSPSSSIGRAHA